MLEALSNLYLPGALPLWSALMFALTSLWGYSLVMRGDESARPFARRAYRFFALSVVLTAAVLGFALFTRDFRIEYVFQYSGMDLPAHYQFAAFWAGQQGSFLIWLFWGSLLGVPLILAAGKRQEPTVMVIYQLSLLALLFILVRDNPFTMLAETPLDGKGLNPLLQDDWMVIHPPIMFIGFSVMAIPFSFAMAALWRREPDGWAARAFPWALGGFIVLGTAIMMGGIWAYKTLGWGGFWGWDPVENASLVPWIMGTALVHGLQMERSKQRYRRANYVMAAIAYLAVLYGTFLTRSGVLADFSVHSFVEQGTSKWLLGFLLSFILLSLYLLISRLRSVPTNRNEDPPLSRGSVLVLGTITLIICGIVIAFGTSAPLLTAFLKNPGQVGPEFYNRINLPIALVLALLLAVVPFMTWKGIAARELLKKLTPSLVAAAGLSAVAIALGVRDPFHLMYIFLASWALTSNLHKIISLLRIGGLARAGGYVTHVGVGLMLLGFMASSAYDEGTKLTLDQGTAVKVQDMVVTFKGFDLPDAQGAKQSLRILIEYPDGTSYEAHPRMFRNQRTGQLMVNPDVRVRPLSDLYISPIDYDPGDSAGQRLALVKGQAKTVGEMSVRFVDFDLDVEGNALAQMSTGGLVTIGARIELTQADGTNEEVVAIYRLDQANGTVETPPIALAGGGAVMLSGINASDGSIRVDLVGVASASGGQPPRLSVDITKKPLIQLVWFGLYVLVIGGVLATVQRLKQLRTLVKLDRAG